MLEVNDKNTRTTWLTKENFSDKENDKESFGDFFTIKKTEALLKNDKNLSMTDAIFDSP